MSKKISGKVLAIQLGRDETQLVLLGSTEEILHAASVPTPAGAVDDGMIRNPDAVRTMLKEALEDPGFKKVRRAVFSLCTSQVITETVTTPELPAARLEKLIRANADMYFPVDTQEYQLVWQVIGPKNAQEDLKELLVQLWAVPTAMLTGYYQVANGCGLSVASIDYCGHSVATVMGASFAAPGKEAKTRKKLSLDMELSFGGKKKAKAEPRVPGGRSRPVTHTDLHLLLDKDLLGMTFIQNGQVVMQRFIRCGSNPVYQFGELSMMLEYFRSMESGLGSEINGFISGWYAGDEAVVAELEDMLGISLSLLAVPYDLRWCLCVGAVGSDLEFGIPALNVADKSRRQMQSQLWQYGLVLGGALALLAVFLYILSARLVWDSDIRNLESSKQTLTLQAAKVNGFADNYADYERMYNAYSADWDTVFGNMQTYNDNLVLVMDELEALLPEDSSVIAMQIGASGLDVTFACENKEEAAYLIMALREMQYADLMAISDLQGGGGGPAESFGSGRSEPAPVDGSSELTAAEWARLEAAVSADLAPCTVGYHLGLGVDIEDHLDEVEIAYGLVPANQYKSFSSLKNAYGSKLTRQIRADAFSRMCNDNPFAIRGAENLMMDESKRDMELALYIDTELGNRDSSSIQVYRHRSVEDLKNDIALLVDVIVTPDSDYDALSAVEKLLCKDSKLEALYVYYLEGQLNKKDDLHYLNMDRLISDLLDGEFNSKYSAVNTKLYSLLSRSTLDLLEELTREDPTEPPTEPVVPPTEPTVPPTEPVVPPTEPTVPPTEPIVPPTEPTVPPTEPVVPPTEPTVPPTEPVVPPTDPTVPPTDPSEPSGGGSNDKYEMLIDMYLPTYLRTGSIPGAEDYTDQIDVYFTEGKTGTAYDSIINDYIDAGKADTVLVELLEVYHDDPDALKNQAVREMLDNYYAGGTGNPVLDAWIERCDSGNVRYDEEVLKRWLKLYLTYGKTYDNTGDAVIEAYLVTGKLEQAEYSDILDDYVSDGKVDAELKNLLYYYLYNKTAIKNEHIITMFDNYYDGTTGSAALDVQIRKLSKAIAQDAVQNPGQNPGGSGGQQGGQQGQPQDTRIFFAVILNYNEELRNAELNRKGMYYDDKLTKLEVKE